MRRYGRPRAGWVGPMFAMAAAAVHCAGGGPEGVAAQQFGPASRHAVATIVDQRVLSTDSLAQVTAVGALPESALVAVLDGVTGLIALFDARTGIVRRYLGGKGGGPGRLNCASRLLLRAGSVFVLDHCRQRIIELTLEGREVRQVAVPAGEATLEPYAHFAWANATLLYSGRISALRAAETKDHIRYGTDQLVAVVDSSARVVVEATSAWVNLTPSGPPFLVPAAFGHRLTWDVQTSDGLIAVSRDQAFLVEFVNADAKPVGSLRLPIQGRAVTGRDRSDLLETYGAEFRSHRGSLDLGRMSFPERMPAIRSLRFDPTGALWLLTTEAVDPSPEPDSLPIVIWRHGEPRFIQLRFRCFPLAFLGQDQLVCREEDSLGVQYLRLYRVRVNVAPTTR